MTSTRHLPLHTPGWRITAFALTAIGVATVRASSPSRGEWCVDGPVERRCGLGFTIGVGWGMLFYAEAFPEWLRVLLAVGWTAGLLVPTGFLVRRRWESLAGGVVVIVALAVLPGVPGLLPTRGIEWLGAALGLVTGAMTARVVAGSRALKRALGRGAAS